MSALLNSAAPAPVTIGGLLNSAAPAPVFSLSSVAMLARLSISQWTARKFDKQVTEKVISDHNARSDAGRWNKLLVNKGAIQKIQAIAGQARLEHEARTLPWHDRGARILSSVAFDDYAAKMHEYRVAFEEAVEVFCATYEAHKETAKLQLNGLYREGDYPALEDIRSRFHFEVTMDVLPDSSDFRVSMSQSQAAIIRAEIEARTQRAIADAMRDVWTRVADNVGHMATKLRAYDPDNAKADCFRDTLVDNIRELVALLPGLNVTSDPTLATIAARMELELCGDDAKALRKDESLRDSVAAAAEAILKDVSDFLA